MDINRNNYETFFLLYLDRELNPADRQSVEKFLSENADLQKEFSLLKQTVFTPTEMVFENKESLFRVEENRRVIPMNWLRMAAAVAFLILGSWLTISRLSNNHADDFSSGGELATINDSMNKNDTPENPNTGSQDLKAEPSKTNGIRAEEKVLDPANQTGEKRIQETTSHKNDVSQNITAKQSGSKELPVENQDLHEPASNMIPDEAVTAVKKSNTNVEIQSVENQQVMETKQPAVQPSGETQAIALAAGAEVPVQYDYAVLNEGEFQTDNAISVVALNDKNKGITNFFKKLTKRAPADDKARKVRVSVFQFSY